MRTAALALLASLFLVGTATAQAPSELLPSQPVPANEFDLGFRLDLEPNTARVLTSTRNIRASVRCVVRQPNPPADTLGSITAQIILNGPNPVTGTTTEMFGMGLDRQAIGNSRRIQRASSVFQEGNPLAAIDVEGFFPPFMIRFGTERIIGLGQARLDGDGVTPCCFKITLRQRGQPGPDAPSAGSQNPIQSTCSS